MPATAVVFTGGDPPGARAVGPLPSDRFVVAADSGLHHAHALGIAVDVAVGDFDSVDADALRHAEAHGTRVERHPAAKEHTDLELALDVAVEAGATRLLVIGGQGGRLDHWLGNIAVLTSPKYAGLRLEARAGRSRLFVVRDEVSFEGQPGEYVSLLAWNGAAERVRTHGLRWALHGERLEPGSSRGVSNELVDPTGRVEVATGLVLVVLPGERSPMAGGAEPVDSQAE